MEHGSQDVIQFPKEKEKLVITDEMILKFVEECRKKPVKENPENMARFLKCHAMAKELAEMLPGGQVLPIVADPTFHHAMSVNITCNKVLIEGEICALLRQLIQECNVFSVFGKEKFCLGFSVSFVWEAIEDD